MKALIKICSECEYPLDPKEDFYSKRSVCKYCHWKETKKGRPPALAGKEVGQAVGLYRSGMTLKQVAKEMGVSATAIQRLLVREGVKARSDAQHQKVLNDPFAVIDTEEKAYWLGFLATDGNVYGSRVQLNLSSRDVDHLVKWCLFLGLDPDKEIKTRKKKGTEYEVSTVVFRSKAVCQSLKRQGIEPGKSFTVVPWEGPPELMRHYWRGCLDGDGWVTTEQTGFCGNRKMVEGFAALFGGYCGPHVNIFKTTVYGVKRDRLLAHLYQDSTVSLERKRRVVEELLEGEGSVQQKLQAQEALEGADRLP